MNRQTCDVTDPAGYLLAGSLGETIGLISNAMAMGLRKVEIDADHAMAMAKLAMRSLTCPGSHIGMLREASAWAALAANNMAALETAVGTKIPDNFVFGGVPAGDLSGSINLTAGDIRALAAAFHATADGAAPAPVLAAEVDRLVRAARAIAIGHVTTGKIRELDAASEAFAVRMDWDDGPMAAAAPSSTPEAPAVARPARDASASCPCLSQAALDVLDERQRQIEAEGWTPELDAADHDDGDLAAAASAYALHAADMLNPHSQGDGHDVIPDMWPFSQQWWKPTAPRRDLVKSGALILAEIERLDGLEDCRG